MVKPSRHYLNNITQTYKGWVVMNKMNPVVHFEMPAEDRHRMADFYAKSFGWHTKHLGPEMGNYVVVSTIESDDNGRPQKPGAINGGFYQRTADANSQYPSVVIGVDNLEESMKRVTEAGGKIEGNPTDIPGVGLYVSFLDTEGNRVSMLQPSADGGM